MKNYRIEAIILTIGLSLMGLFIYFGLASFSAKDRVVSVRGLAECEMKADRVNWPVVYKTTGNDLQTIYTQLNNVNNGIVKFLVSNGIPQADISINAPSIVDLKADRYASETDRTRDRYNVTSIIMVTSSHVEEARKLMPRMGELLKQGIAISAGDYDSKVQYEFTSLNKVKPQMIEEATKNAREAAIKFSNDSNSKIGKIKTASQGLFTIEDRDQYTPYIKKVRVVTSIDYFVEN